jgi:glycine betaine/choline ABC-type transport system substrate-binding protein
MVIKMILTKHIMRNLKCHTPLIGMLILSMFALLILSCTKDTDRTTIRIGSKNFSEQFILAEIMAQLIENRTPLKVKRIFNLGGTMICHNALMNGKIDLYPEYTGTGLTAILQQDVIVDPDEAYKIVSRKYRDAYQLKWLKPFGFNNTYALAVRGSDARKKGWTTISDLVSTGSKLKAGFTAEFIERSDGYPGLKKKYDLSFQSVKDMDPGLMYRAIAEKEVDVISAFATDGRIKAYNLFPLEDDSLFFPPYYAAPVVRLDIVKKYPDVEKVLHLIAGLIDNSTMQQLNYAVDVKKQSPEEVARKYLRKAGLISGK